MAETFVAQCLLTYACPCELVLRPSETGLSSVYNSHTGAKKKTICTHKSLEGRSQVVCCIADEWFGCAGFGIQAKESFNKNL